MIREEEPPRPSTRLSDAPARRCRPSRPGGRPSRRGWPRLVRGDLDWIVMKALEKDRARRYETATGLARDVERYLADEPVEAGPPSAAYRLRKFARRHPRGLITAAAFVGLLARGRRGGRVAGIPGVGGRAGPAEAAGGTRRREGQIGRGRAAAGRG